jgi:hypothetical protein
MQRAELVTDGSELDVAILYQWIAFNAMYDQEAIADDPDPALPTSASPGAELGA